ncbi:MAG: ATP-binding protein [Treponema sp.]|nr:ATP-binding protein [Treponema sp.]
MQCELRKDYRWGNTEMVSQVLLFNEADAIIGRRMGFNADSRAVDQMENSIQNIILQEMEDLSGILIATTNLAKNMDKAFERRFLYKYS